MKKSFCTIILFLTLLILSCGERLMPELEVEDFNWDSEKISIKFSEEPSPVSIHAAFSLTEDGSATTGTFEFKDETIYYYPDNLIRKNYDYTLIISTKAEDTKGRSLTENFIRKFSTREENTPPYIKETSPSTETKLSEQPKEISIEFSEPVTRESFISALSVTPSFDYAISYSDNDSLFKLLPLENLKVNSNYTITVSTSLEDYHRNKLLEEYSFIFTCQEKWTSPAYNIEIIQKDGENKEISNKGFYDSLEKTSILHISFSDEMQLSDAASLFSVSPKCNYSLKTDKLENKYIEISFPAPDWGAEYTILFQGGLKDIYGNKIENDTVFTLCFDNEKDRPVEFVSGYMQTGDWTSKIIDDLNFKKISGENNFTPIIFSEYYPAGKTIESMLYLIFSTSKKSEGLLLESLLASISFSNTNSSCTITPKKIQLLTENDYMSFPAENFINDCKNEISGEKSIVAINLEITNTSKSGIITLTLEKKIKDTLGNTMMNDCVFTLNK